MGPLSASLAAYAEDLRARWGLSALSVSLVDGRSQGFGRPTSGPIIPDTTCLIASNTKLFTAVAIGILVDQGKLSFDSKIKDLIPGFKLANEHTTEHATVADAMSQSTGCTRALRARLLEQPYWGRLVAPITLMAIWDTTDAILRDFASLHHLGGNVYYGEWFKRYSAQGPEESVVVPMSAVDESTDSLFYAFEGSNGEMHLEVVHSASHIAPVVSLGKGDFTFSRLQTFG